MREVTNSENKTDSFIKKYRIRGEDIDVEHLTGEFISEMEKGLEGQESSLRMIPTYIEADNEFKTGVTVTAIDAGGTNFRAANVLLTDEGKISIWGMVKEKMPGISGEISKDDFFQKIAGYVKNLVNETDHIGFCFSYPTEILPNRDGKLLQFSKEVQAPGVIGEKMGQNLLDTLGMSDKQIVLLNDTVATLLAGKTASFKKTYDSYIGFILGTGTNTCYIESNRNITKKPDLDPGKNQAINIESGNFSKAPRTEIDLKFDETTNNPGEYTFEKMISGGYFGGLALTALKMAAEEGLFSDETTERLLTLEKTTTEDINRFMAQDTEHNPLASVIDQKNDEEAVIKILHALVGRAAKQVAAKLAAIILKTGKGKNESAPILITVEGTAYYVLYGLRKQVESGLKEFLSGENKRHFEFAKVDQSSLVGAALAALSG